MYDMYEGDPIVFNPDGGWCWFQDERAIIDEGKLLIGSVSSTGDITLTHYNFESAESDTLTIHYQFQQNDHAQPALIKRTDGRYLINYSGHFGEYSKWRISEEPGDPTRWGPVQQVDVGDLVTYSNLYHLQDNDRTYNFHRGIDWHPNVMVSDDDGDSWEYLGRLFIEEGERPYPRYASNGQSRIHFVTTNAHPRDFVNNIYHGYVENDRLFNSEGTEIGAIDGAETERTTDDFTMIFEGDEENIPWTSDIRIDADGHPYIAYSVTKDRIRTGEGGMDHRYRYARWDGEQWNDYEIAYAGTRLYANEDEYTGLIVLDPDDPDIVYISTDVQPESGEPLISESTGEPQYEIFKGSTSDSGENWNWEAITEHSAEDNIRPYITSDGSDRALLWLRGEYRTYTDYSLEIVGYVSR
ncbi:BNR-4 repeat-containing protein [Rhodohalobacter sp. SW132]|nr:BNR-4 repeat-containing protein [Rhodohalobacter sp. SW132]